MKQQICGVSVSPYRQGQTCSVIIVDQGFCAQFFSKSGPPFTHPNLTAGGDPAFFNPPDPRRATVAARCDE
jgi:hypothetical protein